MILTHNVAVGEPMWVTHHMTRAAGAPCFTVPLAYS